MIEPATLRGLWRRSLIAWPSGERDTTTWVGWLQAISLYADLRQPHDLAQFPHIRCLDDLERKDLVELARQEAFAGRLVRRGEVFEWQRLIDFQCPAATADAGYLEFSGDVLIERGAHVDYLEHWHQRASATIPCVALALSDDAHGIAGQLVRCGDLFMYARGRPMELPHGGSLQTMIGSLELAEARAIVDVEISYGHISARGWRIERSTLPYRVAQDLAPERGARDAPLCIVDMRHDGSRFTRAWRVHTFETEEPVTSIDGAISTLLLPA